MGSPLIHKAAVLERETTLYTEGFAAILAENAPAANPAPVAVPVDTRPAPVAVPSPIHRRQEPSFHSRGYEAALGGLLLLIMGATTWYEIVDPVWSTPTTVSRPAPSLHLRPMGETALADTVRLMAADGESILEAIDLFPRHSGVETATEAATASVQRPATDVIASLAEAVPDAPASRRQLPEGTIGVRPASDLDKPGIDRNGEFKGPVGNPFVDTYPGEPRSALDNITTASRTGTGASQKTSSPASGSTDVPDVGPDADAHHPHSGVDAPGRPSQGQQESESDSPAPGRNSDNPAPAKDKLAPANDKPALAKDKPAAAKDKPAPAKDKPAAAKDKPAPAKDKPAAGKGAPAGHKDDHISNGGKSSPGKADKKGDGDKKDKPGKDKNDKDKGKGPH